MVERFNRQLRSVYISGTGSYLPEKLLTNADFEKLVDTNDEWIVQRTGMRERRVAAEDQATSDLAFEAAKKAIESAGLKPTDIDQIIVATVTPDHAFPSTACLVQHKLGCRAIQCFDLSAACSGFLYGLAVARTAIAACTMEHVLVIGAEVLTRFTNYKDRGSCILFGDGAGAAVLSPSHNGCGIIDTHMAADGEFGNVLILPAGGSRIPPSHEALERGEHYMRIDGKSVFKLAVSHIVELVDESLERCGLTRDNIDLIIPHQMNARIIESAAKRLEIPMEKIYMNLARYGNTSAATIPIAIDEAIREGRVKPGMLVVLVAFGGGLTWSSALIRW